MIKLVDVCKQYNMNNNKINALSHVNLAINRHEFVSISGPSGSGKSTLINILGCLDKPDRGEYFLDDMDISQTSFKDLAGIRSQKIGFIFQQFNLLGRMTAIENVELPLIFQGVSPRERRQMAKQALCRVSLGDRINHRPKELSGGQQQRVAIARALCTSPSIILADEPTGNLDSKSGGEIMALLRQVHKQGNTVIIITHDTVVAQAADRRITIADGRIAKDEFMF